MPLRLLLIGNQFGCCIFADVPKAPNQPKVQDLRGTSVVLRWDSQEVCVEGTSFSLETCRLRSSEPWAVIKSNIREGLCQIDNLKYGETYSFRVLCHSPSGETSEPSPPSNPLTIPLLQHQETVQPSSQQTLTTASSRRSSTSNSEGSSSAMAGSGGGGCGGSGSGGLDTSCWQRDFERKYIELEELGRGRFSVVRKCQEILSGTEVAVKFVNRRKQSREDTQREYEILANVDHPNVVRATGLFLTATSDAIVLNL